MDLINILLRERGTECSVEVGVECHILKFTRRGDHIVGIVIPTGFTIDAGERGMGERHVVVQAQSPYGQEEGVSLCGLSQEL